MLLPLSLVSLATPGCGMPYMALNLTSAAAIGTAVAGLAYAATGRHHAYDRCPLAVGRSADAS